MTDDKIVTESLEHLFKEYITNGGSGRFSIDEVVYQNHGQDPTKTGGYLVENELVKNQFYAQKGFAASITMKGILKIRPDYLDEYKNKITSTLDATGNDWISILKVLDFQAMDYQIAFDIAKTLEEQCYIQVQELKYDDLLIKLP